MNSLTSSASSALLYVCLSGASPNGDYNVDSVFESQKVGRIKMDFIHWTQRVILCRVGSELRSVLPGKDSRAQTPPHFAFWFYYEHKALLRTFIDFK